MDPFYSALKVPFIDLKRSFLDCSTDILAGWQDVLEHAEFVGGKRVAEFERNLKDNLGVQSALACANGTDAIVLALQASGIKSGMKVALPNLTFWATYEAVIQIGAIPVLIDICNEDLQMDFDELVSAHRKLKLDAVLTAHLYGWASRRLGDLRTYCASQKIPLIEDGAQAFGVQYEGESIFKNALIATLSFYPAKVLGGAMDGGAIVGTEKNWIETARSLANHGRSEHYQFARVGWNSRMGGLQATFLSKMLERLPNALASRRNCLENYRKAFANSENTPKGIKLFVPPANIIGNGYLATLTWEGENGESAAKLFTSQGIGCARVYPQTILEQTCVPKDILRVSELSRSLRFVKQVVNIPLFAYMTEEECAFVISVVQKGNKT